MQFLELIDHENVVKKSGPPDVRSGGMDAAAKKPGACSIDDLTWRIRDHANSERSPFADAPLYISFFDLLCRALHRNSPRHVIILRERGVGEQIVLIDLAKRMEMGTPTFLKGKKLFALDCKQVSSDDAGSLIQEICSQFVSREEAVVCLEGMANLIRRRVGQSDPALIFSAVLLRLQCRILGIMSSNEFDELIAANAELRDLFTIIVLHEPDLETAFALVRSYADGLQMRYSIAIEDDAVRRAVFLSSSCILHERLPHKAVRVLREICDDVAYERCVSDDMRPRITEKDVIAKIAQICNIPEQTLSGVGEGVDYERSLGELIVGQQHAVREVAKELGLIKAGFVDAGKPASVMMFIGQTGTGKTEMAKVLAKFYSSSKRLKTFTLGNFSEAHSVSGLIGVPPGYVGHEQGGRLVNELNADPYGVFLLDEADKAHPDVMQPFLNLFDEGWLTDQRGVKAFANRAIFILTTNVGQRQIADMCKNGKSIDEITATMKESLSRIRHTKSNRPVFAPEFLARVKRIVVFRTLDQEAMLGISRRLVADMQIEWQQKRQKMLVVPLELVNVIAVKAFQIDEKSQGREGGRIVRKLLADVIETRIQSAISASPEDYRNCRTVSVTFSPLESNELSNDLIRVSFHVGEGVLWPRHDPSVA